MGKVSDLLKNCYKKEDINIKIRFYQTPKFLIHSDAYKDLGLAEKLVYSILRDRLELSLNNETDDFVDENGYVFLRYDRTKLAELLNISVKSVNRYIIKLAEYNLLVNIRDGQGRSNRIYITDISKQLEDVYTYEDKDIISKEAPEDIENTLKGQKVLSRKDKKSYLERTKSPTINTEYNNTEFIDTKSINQSSTIVEIDRLIDLEQQIKRKGFKTYNELINHIGLVESNFEYPLSEYVNAIKRAIFEMYNYDDTKIKGKKIGRFDIISKLQNLNFDIIEATINKTIERSKTHKIKYVVAFLKTTLFNEIDEHSASIQTQVNYDLSDSNDNQQYDDSYTALTRFHNFEGRTSLYSEEELENIAKKKRNEYFKKRSGHVEIN